jgi:hypothetical protein
MLLVMKFNGKIIKQIWVLENRRNLYNEVHCLRWSTDKNLICLKWNNKIIQGVSKLNGKTSRVGSSYREMKKRGVTTWVQKCMVTELSERVFTECMPTRPDCRNKLWDTGYNFYTSNQVTSYTIMQLTEFSNLLVTLVQSDTPNTVALLHWIRL